MKISVNDPNYPDYFITFDGNLVPAAPVTVRGPHSFELLPPAPGIDIQVALSRNPADPNVPDLTITISQNAE